MITWRSVPGGATADVIVRGRTIARLHARRDAWRVEMLAGDLVGPAGSLGAAKRCALDTMAELLGELAGDLRAEINRG